MENSGEKELFPPTLAKERGLECHATAACRSWCLQEVLPNSGRQLEHVPGDAWTWTECWPCSLCCALTSAPSSPAIHTDI